jgi:hypothetical protein
MGNSGVGMLLGEISVTAVWILFLGAFVLGAALLYGIVKSGRLRRSQRAQLDRNTEMAQDFDDPQKRTEAVDRQGTRQNSRGSR